MVVRVGDIEIAVGNRKRGDQGVYVGRPTALGNPYSTGMGRMRAIDQYRVWLRKKLEEKDPVVCGAMERLRRRAVEARRLMLVCWCHPLPCHAEVIADELARVISADKTFGTGGNGG